MKRHLVKEHDDFTSRVIKSRMTALSRQIYETWLIKSHKMGLLLNSKFEYNHRIIPTLSTGFTTQPLGKKQDSHRSDRLAQELVPLEDKRYIMKRVQRSEETIEGDDKNPKNRKKRRLMIVQEDSGDVIKNKMHQRKFSETDQENDSILACMMTDSTLTESK